MGACLTFSGGASGSYLNVPSPSGLPTTAMTVSAWVNLTSHISWDNLAINNWGLSTGGVWLLFSDAGRNVFFGVKDGAAAQHSASGCSAAFTTNAWHNLLGTYDGTTVKVYIDGVICAGTSALSNQTLYTAGSISMGSVNASATSHKMDDIRIYNRALSAAEIYALYSATR
ncbi:MAG: LamG domain-containing protein [Candidatus Liptonbacteria bacterium]|nr:LamG domain-containing protein [Candidatus Liptonbacteria bacterium]